MGRISKGFGAFFILIMAISSLSLFMVKPASAQSTPMPFVPEFSLQYVNTSYYLAPTYTTNPYTGQNQTINSGGQVNNYTIQFIIRNQPFTSYKDANGNYTNLYYGIRFKGHYTGNWQYYPNDPTVKGMDEYILASDSDDTVADLPIWVFYNVPSGGQVDFQMEALIGYDYGVNGYAGGYKTVYYYFNGIASDYSNTQTMTFADGGFSSSITASPYPTLMPAPTLTPSPTPAPAVPTSIPTVPEFPTLMILPLFVLATLLSIILTRKISKIQTKRN